MSDFKISNYVQGDEKNIVKLLEDSFERWPNHELNCKAIDHWKWKYLDNPTNLKNNVYMTDNLLLIGCDHTFFKQVKIGKNTKIVGVGSDTATHKDYRGRGIYKELAAKKKQQRKNLGINLNYWITSNQIFIEYAKKMQRPTFPHPITNMIKILDVDQYFGPTTLTERGINKIGYILLSKTKKIEILQDPDIEIKIIKKFDYTADTFWNKIKKHYNFIIERDSNYLNYRYCDPRAGKYCVFSFYEKNEMIGYIVIEKKIGKILDLLTLPDRSDALDLLIHSAFEYFTQKGINRVNCWAIEGHPLKKSLSKHGFISVKKDLPHLFFNEEAGQELMGIQYSSPEKLHLSIGDTDEI